jgi:Uma2 family endonuclease
MSRTGFVTAEELARMGEGRRELIRGRVVEMSPVGLLHGRVTGTLYSLLREHLRGDAAMYLSAGDPGCVLERRPDTVRAPDVAVFRTERLEGHDEGKYAPFAPDLAAEVASPGDSARDLREKALMWLSFGSRLAWVVDPGTRRVTVYEPSAEPRELCDADVLGGGEVLPGLAIPVRSIFE